MEYEIRKLMAHKNLTMGDARKLDKKSKMLNSPESKDFPSLKEKFFLKKVVKSLQKSTK